MIGLQVVGSTGKVAGFSALCGWGVMLMIRVGSCSTPGIEPSASKAGNGPADGCPWYVGPNRSGRFGILSSGES